MEIWSLRNVISRTTTLTWTFWGRLWLFTQLQLMFWLNTLFTPRPGTRWEQRRWAEAVSDGHSGQGERRALLQLLLPALCYPLQLSPLVALQSTCLAVPSKSSNWQKQHRPSFQDGNYKADADLTQQQDGRSFKKKTKTKSHLISCL